MSPLSRPVTLCTLVAVAAGALAVAAFTLATMVVPGIDPLPSSLAGHLGAGVERALSLIGALAALVLSVGALVARAVFRSVPPWLVRTAALVAALLLALTTPGGIIPAAGYAFAVSVVGGIVALVVLVALRRPWRGLLLGAVLIGVAAAAFAFGSGELVPRVAEALGAMLPGAAVPLAHVVASAGLLIWTIGEAAGARGRLAIAVLRHRRSLTVAAAACALPYVVARASWLTPWPLFGGSAELFAAEPTVRVVGLVLGAGMLAGGVLTLGLIRPWGLRFPRSLAGLGGRRVPPALAIIPASVVSVLFTAAGLQFAVEGTGSIGETGYLLLMFPFWLWGPLLGLATWGYAMVRATRPARQPATASAG